MVLLGGYVTLAGATAVDGITADELNQNFEILTVPDATLLRLIQAVQQLLAQHRAADLL